MQRAPDPLAPTSASIAPAAGGSAGGGAQLLCDSPQGRDAALDVRAPWGVALAHRAHELPRRTGRRRSGCRMAGHGDTERLGTGRERVEVVGERGNGRLEIVKLLLQVSYSGRCILSSLSLIAQARGR